MRRNIFRLVVVAGVWWFWVPLVPAQVPPMIRYQGTLVDANNVPLEGAHTLTFRLYEAATEGGAVWSETQTGVPVSRGVFSIMLGQATALTLSFDKDYWLSTQVGADAEMSPRQRLTSVPYAYRAESAERVVDQPPGFGMDTQGTLLDGLIAYWKLEEPGGTRDDQKGPYDLAAVNGVTQAAGKVGNAAKFTAANTEWLSIADNADLSLGADTPFTVAVWVYLDVDPADDRIIATKGDSNVATTEWWLRYIGGATDRFQFRVNSGAAGAGLLGDTFGPATVAVWIFVVAWHDPVADTVNLQVNNGGVDSVAWAGGTMDTSVEFTVGRWGSGIPGSLWDGRVDEMGFWKRVLTAQERADLYNAGAGTTYTLGKAANPWTNAGAGIAYLEGNLGVGTASSPNILTIQQNSPTDPIADSWTVYPSDRLHKQILSQNPIGYLDRLKSIKVYEWQKLPLVSDDEAKQALRTRKPTPQQLAAKKRELAQAKTALPKFQAKRVGMVIDDDNIPPEVLSFNPDGSKAGIDLLAYMGYIHAALKEAALKIGELEAQLSQKPSPEAP